MFARPFSQRVEFTSSMVCLAALALTIGLVAASQPGALPQIGGTDASAGEGVVEGYGELPLAFEENRGQTDGQVDFLARASGQTALLQSTGATVSLQPSSEDATGAAVRLKLTGADPAASPIGVDRLTGEVNVLRGDNPANWTTGAPTFERVRYADVYPGIDVAWYGTQAGELEYDFVVAPGADPGAIGIEFDGARRVSLSDSGALRIETAAGTLVQRPPVTYQQIDGRRAEVSSRYELSGERARVAVGAYDAGHPLVIDPTLAYSTLLGPGSINRFSSIAVDGSGSAYVAGTAFSGFPTTPGAFDTSHTAGFSTDAFVAKLSPDGSALDYSTYVGGSSGSTNGFGIAVDGTGSAYLTGETETATFPATPGAFDTSFNGAQDAFVAKLNPAGSGLDYATLLGGNSSDQGYAIAIDGSASAYITGLAFSPGYPTTPGAFDTTKNGPGPGGPTGDARDAMVTKLNPAGSALEYSTFLGGELGDDGLGIQVDSSGSAHVAGVTESSAFPTTPGVLDETRGGASDGFAAKLASDGSALEYSTYVGGSAGDAVNAVDLGSGGNAYLGGSSASTDLPTTPGAFDESYNGGQDAFVAKLNGSGDTLIYSTFLGGASGLDSANGIAVDGVGRVSVSGDTQATDFPTSPDAFDGDYNGGIRDAFVAQLDTAGASLDYSTYMGGPAVDQGMGIALEASGSAYVAGRTTGAGFPTTPGAFDETFNGGSSDAFVAKLEAPPLPGSWTPTGDMSETRGQHTATLLDDGRVLVAGGNGANGVGPYAAMDSADIYDPALETWSPAADLPSPRRTHAAVLLENGKVLVVGGMDQNGNAMASAALYDPTTGNWSVTGSMADPRVSPSATLLPDGKVLVAGGMFTSCGGGCPRQSAELYDPGTGNWSSAGNMSTGRIDHTATALADGTVLVAGGYNPFAGGARASTDIYDPDTGTWSATGDLGTARNAHAAALLADGSVLVAGGVGSSGSLTSAEVYDPGTGTWSGTDSMAFDRQAPTATLLPDETVLVTAGISSAGGGGTVTAEIFDPTAGTWAFTDSMSVSHTYATATLLGDGRVLVAGGFDYGCCDVATAELYESAGPPPDPDTDDDGIANEVDPDPGTASEAFDDGDGTAGAISDRAGLEVTIEDLPDPDGIRIVVGAGSGKVTLSVCGGLTVKVSAGSEVELTCGSVTLDVIEGDAEVELGGGSTAVFVPAGVRATVTENQDGSFTVENHGGGDVTVTVDGVESTVGPGETTDVRTWHFVGFTSPVDNPPVLNVANAGQAIPLKWRLLDASGAPVTNLTSAHMTATSLACSLGSTADLLEESAPGNSGLQNLGNGYYQLNWKTPKGYAKSCKTLHLDLREGITRDAYFQFRK